MKRVLLMAVLCVATVVVLFLAILAEVSKSL